MTEALSGLAMLRPDNKQKAVAELRLCLTLAISIISEHRHRHLKRQELKIDPGFIENRVATGRKNA